MLLLIHKLDESKLFVKVIKAVIYKKAGKANQLLENQLLSLLVTDTVEVKGLTQADIESTLFAPPPICITYNRQSKVVENVSQ